MNPTLELSELDYRIGQLFMIGMPGTRLDETTKGLIRDFNIGGIILFSRNIVNPYQLARLCRDIKDASEKYHGTSPFIAVDQEGGRVARLKKPFTLFPGNKDMGKSASPLEDAREFGRVTAHEMTLVGLNMDLAPVMDVEGDSVDRHLEGRIFSASHESVSKMGVEVIKSLQGNGVMAVAKHFPGLGRAMFDPHIEKLAIEAKLEDLRDRDLPPFSAAIRNGVSAIMTSHALYPALDPDYPATCSGKIITNLLRDSLGFRGLVITDDLDMGAISGTRGVPQGALDAFRAGADMLLISKNQNIMMESIEFLRKAVLKDEELTERLDESITRILNARSLYLHNEKKISFSKVKRYFSISITETPARKDSLP